MKIIILANALALTLGSPAFAGETYMRDGWPGEYPLNFEVLKDVTVKARSAPEAKDSADETCTLKKGAKFGPMQANVDGDPYTRSAVLRYHAAKDLELQKYEEGGRWAKRPVKKGTLVEELSYLSEGVCRIRVEGEIIEDSCPSLVEEDFVAEEGQPKDSSFEQWLNVKCPEHAARRWILVDDLEPLFSDQTLASIPFEG